MAKAQRKDEAPTSEEPVSAEATPSEPSEGVWSLPAPLGRPTVLVLVAVVALINLPLIHYFVFRSPVAATLPLPFSDDYSSPQSLANYWTTGGLWRVQDGWLMSPGVKNNPLWLKASLPNDVSIDFDAMSASPEGDIKVEIFGDGSDHASGYVLIFGGWNNSISIISRLDEHGQPQESLPRDQWKADTRVRAEVRGPRVNPNQRYHFHIERRGKVISWSIDGQPFMNFEDPNPLTGKGHDRMGFSSWEAQLYFDNLKITAL